MVDEGHLITVELGMTAQILLDDALQVFLLVILHRIHMAHKEVLRLLSFDKGCNRAIPRGRTVGSALHVMLCSKTLDEYHVYSTG
jgi:hypothetical protein